ncbi:hypothetical protein H4582DRAFT_2118987 [Lactarius indigo]|nr:hypothetical protein H4582DRAFT_2118987 [Lactarius indigo]
MVSKSFIAYAFLLCFTTSVNAHALIGPALGVTGNGTRNDVQTFSANKPCGNTDIAKSIDSSTGRSGSCGWDLFAFRHRLQWASTLTNSLRSGSDGSRSIKTVQVDASGTGQNFVAAKMVVNGDANPTSAGTEQLQVQLPSGTKCTGGTGKNLCLASFVTTAGFGNCVVVSQAQAQDGNPSKSANP